MAGGGGSACRESAKDACRAPSLSALRPTWSFSSWLEWFVSSSSNTASISLSALSRRSVVVRRPLPARPLGLGGKRCDHGEGARERRRRLRAGVARMARERAAASTTGHEREGTGLGFCWRAHPPRLGFPRADGSACRGGGRATTSARSASGQRQGHGDFCATPARGTTISAQRRRRPPPPPPQAQAADEMKGPSTLLAAPRRRTDHGAPRARAVLAGLLRKEALSL